MWQKSVFFSADAMFRYLFTLIEKPVFGLVISCLCLPQTYCKLKRPSEYLFIWRRGVFDLQHLCTFRSKRGTWSADGYFQRWTHFICCKQFFFISTPLHFYFSRFTDCLCVLLMCMCVFWVFSKFLIQM